MDDSKATAIRRKLQETRNDLSCDVKDVVQSGRELADWRYYIRRFPWACLAGAAAMGYLVVPKRVELVQPSPDALEELAKRHKLVVQADPKPQARRGMVSGLLGLLATAAVRGTMAYGAKKFAETAGGQTPAQPNERQPSNGTLDRERSSSAREV